MLLKSISGWVEGKLDGKTFISEKDYIALANYNAELKKGATPVTAYYKALGKASDAAVDMAANTASMAQNADDACVNLTQLAIKSDIAKTALNGLKMAAKAALITFAVTAVVQGITYVIKKVDEYIETAKEAEEATEQLVENFEQFDKEVNSNLKALSSLTKRYDELSKGVDSLGRNIKLTSDEYDEYIDICNQVASIMPELVSYYDEEGRAILRVKENVDSLTESYKKKIQQQAASFVINGDEDGNKIESVLNDYQNFFNGTGGDKTGTAPIYKYSREKLLEMYGIGSPMEILENLSTMDYQQMYDYLSELINGDKASNGYYYIKKLFEDTDIKLIETFHDATGKWSSSLVGNNFDTLHNVIISELTNLETDVSSHVNNINTILQQLTYASGDYWTIDDSNITNAINKFIQGIDRQFIAENFLDSNGELSKSLMQDFISSLTDSIANNQPAVAEALGFLFDSEATITEVRESLLSLADILRLDKGELARILGITDLHNQAYLLFDDVADKVGGRENYHKIYDRLEKFAEEYSINTQEELDDFRAALFKANFDLDAAFADYLNRPKEDPISLTVEDIDNQISLLESRKKQLDNFIKMTETAGYTVSKDMYDKLIAEEEKIQDGLVQQRDILINQLESGLNKGNITEYDESWYELMGQINEVTLAIEESGINLYEYQNIINELDWGNFDKLREIMSDIIDESNFLIDLLSNEKLIDDVGDYTDAGLATLGQHSVNREIYLNEADEYQKKIAELDKQYAEKQDNEYYIKQRREWVDAMRDSISAAEDEKQAMVDLARDGIQAQIDYTQELIDKKKELLSQEQELYEYQKSINEKTDNIANIKKQLSVYENDTSEEGRQRVQQLRNQLKEAEDDLEDTQYDKWVQDQTDMLDDLMTEYEELQNKLSEDTERLFAETNRVIGENGDAIRNTMESTVKDYGYTMSEDMSAIKNAFVGEGSIKTVFEGIETEFNKAVESMESMAEAIWKIVDGETETDGEKHTKLPEYLVPISTDTNIGSAIKSMLEKLDLKSIIGDITFQSTLGNTVAPTVTNALNQFTSKVGDTVIEIGDINLPNVTDAKQFVDQLVNVLQNNNKIQKVIQGMTVDRVAGISKLGIYKH